jgi:hypothetical protein
MPHDPCRTAAEVPAGASAGPDSSARRQWLQGALALSAAGLIGSTTLYALADTPAGGDDLGAFMTLSQALSDKTGLDQIVGGRLYNALLAKTPDLASRIPPIARALAAGTPLDAGQEATALRILEAWYTGIVDGQVITFEGALMFGVVADTLVIRSYCPNKPGFWAQKPIERQS